MEERGIGGKWEEELCGEEEGFKSEFRGKVGLAETGEGKREERRKVEGREG